MAGRAWHAGPLWMYLPESQPGQAKSDDGDEKVSFLSPGLAPGRPGRQLGPAGPRQLARRAAQRSTAGDAGGEPRRVHVRPVSRRARPSPDTPRQPAQEYHQVQAGKPRSIRIPRGAPGEPVRRAAPSARARLADLQDPERAVPPIRLAKIRSSHRSSPQAAWRPPRGAHGRGMPKSPFMLRQQL